VEIETTHERGGTGESSHGFHRVTLTLTRADDAEDARVGVSGIKAHFGLTRESVREWMCLEELPRGASFDETTQATRVGFDETTRSVEILVPEYVAPASLDFVLYDENTETYDEPSGGWGGSSFSVPIGFGNGHARELGVTTSRFDETTGRGAFNVAVLSRHATQCALVLQWGENTMELGLNPISHRTGNVWHVSLPFGGATDLLPQPTRANDILYGFRFEGDPEGRGGSRFFPAQVLFDPRAMELAPPLSEMEEPTPTPRFMGSLAAELERSVVGDAAVRASSDIGSNGASSSSSTIAIDVDVSSLTPEGTLAAASATLRKMREKIWFNAVSLAPIQARSADGQPDAPVSFFAIDPRFGTRADFRRFVADMRAQGVEVWMRFVLTQTGEGTDETPRSESLRGIDAASYFQLGASGGLDSAGVPMTTALNPCSTPTISLLTDALRSFALRDGVSSFIIETGGGIVRGPLGRSPLLETLAHDAVLGNAPKKLWLTPSAGECGTMPSWGTIGEINSKFSQSVQGFFHGAAGATNDLALRVSGSPDIFTSLRDARHGLNAYVSPDPSCGFPRQGSTTDTIESTTLAVARAELATLFTSAGGALVDARVATDPSLRPLIEQLSQFRANHSALFEDVDRIAWINPLTGARLEPSSFDDASAPPALACLRIGDNDDNDDETVWTCYNGTNASIDAVLPSTPHRHHWIRVFDTYSSTSTPASAAVTAVTVPARSVSVCVSTRVTSSSSSSTPPRSV
jgi:pullulanase/glycogen debranching enzyme